MSLWAKLNWLLVISALAVFALNWTLQPDPTQPNFELLPGMVFAVPYESFTANPVLAGGVTMQHAPAGTIPRGRPPLRYGVTPEEAERAGRELESPLDTADPVVLQQAEAVFQVYCQLCHGPGGEGNGTVAQRGFPTPPSLLAMNARNLADGRVFHIVTFGQGNMPGHAGQLEPEERWRAVLWVRQLQQASGPPPDTELQIDDTETAEVGQEVDDAP